MPIPRIALVLVLALAVIPSAAAAPPANDNRADAAPVGAFPFDVHGTLVEATVERLDPQISKCGTVASTVWYRIDTAPDGTITFTVHGAAGVAPVIRIYARGSSALRELACGSAAVGGAATASFDTTRGSSYLILVGRKPASADGDFDLHADLALPPEPPANDRTASATRLRHLPGTVRGTTVGARSEDNDPTGCGLASATVWYRVRASHKGLVVLRLHANGSLDAAVDVLALTRSRLRDTACGRTDDHGNATVAFAATAGTSYLIAVGDQDGSRPGTFSLSAVAAAAPEHTPGRLLPNHLVHATLDGLVNVNDVWHTTLRSGTTYRIAFTSAEGARVTLRRPDQTALLELDGSGYRTFTPGPDGGGTYVFEVEAAPLDRPQPYRLQVAAAGPDDIGIGLPLENQTTRRGSLDPHGVDTVDVYHFDVERRSDVKVTLGAVGTDDRLELVTAAGGRLGGDATVLHRQLDPGRYVVAVSVPPGTPGGAYRLTLLVRDITSTSLTLPAAPTPRHSAVTLRPIVTPAATGTVVIQIDRFDPLAGWQFSRLLRLPAGDSASWTPSSEGNWRVRASYLGSSSASPSRSGYAFVTVR